MKKLMCILSVLICIVTTACGENKNSEVIVGPDVPTSVIVSTKGEKKMYKQITANDAKKIIDSDEEYVILDVREQDEYDGGHIPNAILIPYTEINDKAATLLPDKEKQILVYCRSGRRSKIASENLTELGYTNVKEFGGIIDWPYDIEK